MRIAFHLATPPAPRPELDAAVQEIESLRSAFGGPLTRLYPGATYRPWIPRRRLRAAQVEAWLRLDRQVDLHHVVSDKPLAYPVLRRLERPVVSRLLTPSDDHSALAYLGSFGPIVISAIREEDRARRAAGLPLEAIPPGIEIDRFSTVPPPPDAPFTILFASAPWTRRQFATKGLDALLAALARRPDMRLVLLWRGVLQGSLERRLRASGMAGRTELITETVRPEAVLSRTHVTVLVPSSTKVVKAYPHSLLEALAAGRPVLTSRRLAIADWVRDRRCGQVVEPSSASIGDGLDRLRADYPAYRQAAAALDMADFSTRRCVAAYAALFERTLAAARR